MTAWLLYTLLVGTLLAIAAACVERMCRMAGRPTRWIWIGAMGLAALLAGLAPFRRVSMPVDSPTRAPAVVSDHAEGISATEVAASNTLIVGWVGIEHARTAWRDIMMLVEQRLARPIERYVLPVWMALSTVLFLMFAGVHWRVRRMRRAWPVADIQGIRVRIAPSLGPMVIGFAKPEIVVPRWLLHERHEEQRLVLAHEQEHVRARDPWLLGISGIVAIGLAWHPAIWWMFSRLRLAVELDCDARVLQHGVTARTYGTLLIDLAARCSSLPIGAPALAGTRVHLQQRLLAMTPLAPSFPRIRAAILSVVGLAALLSASLAQTPTVTAQVQANAPVDSGQVDEDPVQPINIREPQYPSALALKNISGGVDLRFIVDTTGRVEPNSFQVKAQTHDEFVEPAKAVLLNGVFKPARFRGRLVRQLVQERVIFKTGATSAEAISAELAKGIREVAVRLPDLVTTATLAIPRDSISRPGE